MLALHPKCPVDHLTEEKMWAEMDMVHHLNGQLRRQEKGETGCECVKSGLRNS